MTLDGSEQHANPFSVAGHGKYYAIPRRFVCNYGGCENGQKEVLVRGRVMVRKP